MNQLRTQLDALGRTVAGMARTSVTRRIDAIAAAAALLRDGEQGLGHALRIDLEASSGLSPAGVAFALETTLAELTRERLHAVYERAARVHGARLAPRGLVFVVLSANVSTAPFHALALPLLFGNAVLAKASQRDDRCGRAFAAALAEADPELAHALAVVTFAGGDVALEDAALDRADAVVVYGRDTTLEAVRRRVHARAAFVGHGHGLGVGYVASDVLRDDDARTHALHAFARDVAAYDQRGCLSPHAILVEAEDDEVTQFARDLSDVGLASLARTMPRGPLPLELASTQLAYRARGVANGTLFEGDGHAVCAEGDAPVRLSPGFRNVQVLSVGGPRALVGRLAPLGVHLKVVGVATRNTALPAALAAQLPSPLAPRIVHAGSMQTPELGVPWDAELPETGLVRYVACETWSEPA